MGGRSTGKLLAAAGIVCLLVAFVLLTSFKGQFGKDTAGKSSVVPMMEDTIDVTPQKGASAESDAPKQVTATVSDNADDGGGKWVVYVTGAVKKPGVYEVSAGSRVYEALSAAGGFTANADQDAVNLAAKLQDGQQIKFLRKGEAAKQAAQPSAASQKPAAAQTGSSGVSAATADSGGRININTASQSELESINGVGQKTAQAIIQYRTQHGPFSRIEDIMDVKGIGEKKFDAMRNQISTGN